MFAVVDIETTGGKPDYHQIIEVAVRITDGSRVISRYDTLVHPGVQVPRGIVALTGIETPMLEDAPVFASIAQELYHLLHDKVFVAHHVNFDYGFLKVAFARCGIAFEPPKLCTVRLGRKAFPQLAGYGLDKISKALDIPITQRHRAGGDAEATAILFNKVCGKLGMEWISKEITKSTLSFPSHLEESEWRNLPSTPGVYILCDKFKNKLYVGKAKRIKERVLQHFSSTKGKLALSLKEVFHIHYIETGNEWAAELLEMELIKQHYPPWNIAGKKRLSAFQIAQYETLGGERRLYFSKAKRGQAWVHDSKKVYGSLHEAREAAWQMVKDYGICRALCFGSQKCEEEDCYCHSAQRTSIHNEKILAAIVDTHADESSYHFTFPGRTKAERGVFTVQNGVTTSIAYYEKDLLENEGERAVPLVQFELHPSAEQRTINKIYYQRFLKGGILDTKMEIRRPIQKEEYVFKREYQIAAEA